MMEGRHIYCLVFLSVVLYARAHDGPSLMKTLAGSNRPQRSQADHRRLEEDESGNVLVDGDMYVSKDQYKELYGAQNTARRSKRSLPSTRAKRWPNAEMPYTIDTNNFNVWEQYEIHRAFTQWEKYTCFKFTPKNDTHKYWAELRNGYGGCNSVLGFKNKSPQYVNLDNNGCHFKGLYLHETGHALGLIHEQQRPDRDQHIWVIFEDVYGDMDEWFDTYHPNDVKLMKEIEYEYSSIMHYGIRAFSKDGKAQTIMAKNKSREHEIGRVFRKELGYSDAKAINLFYKCADHCPDKDKCGETGHLDEYCNCICKDGSSDCDPTKPKVNTDESCKNVHWHSWRCYLWANQGECERNAFYMEQWCAKACGFCGPKKEASSECVDKYHKNNKCSDWASRGDCISNREWMKRNCPKSCNYCEEGTSLEEDCEDEYTYGNRCLDKARDGDCIPDPVGMYTNCRKSCRWCNKKLDDVSRGLVTNRFKEQMLECKDTNPNCGNWAKHGSCESNPTTMINTCPKSCDKCDDGTCKNLYNDQECDNKAARGDCMTDPNFMAIRCARSCRRGVCIGVVNPPSTKAPLTTTTADPSCVDPNGEDWCKDQIYYKGSNICNTRDMYSCKKTCGICGPCEDKDPNCKDLDKDGYCRTDPAYMYRNCVKTCRACHLLNGK